MIPTTPRPVISDHVEQQMIKSSTEVSSPPTLSGPGPSSDQAVCVSSVGDVGPQAMSTSVDPPASVAGPIGGL